MARTESVAVVGVGHTRYGKLPEYDAYSSACGRSKRRSLRWMGMEAEQVEMKLRDAAPTGGVITAAHETD